MTHSRCSSFGRIVKNSGSYDRLKTHKIRGNAEKSGEFRAWVFGGVVIEMDIEEFEDLLDRLGEDLSRWPAEKQKSASVLLAQSGEARELLREAATLRSLLSKSPIRAPEGLADRIVVQASRTAGTEKEAAFDRLWAFPAWREGRTLFLSICFLGGILAGVLSSETLRDLPMVDIHGYVAYVAGLVYPID
jgi:hypothetical protein